MSMYAYVIENGRLAGEVKTVLASGSLVDFGSKLTPDGALVKSGRGKISRAKKWDREAAKMSDLSRLYVNIGGGGAQ